MKKKFFIWNIICLGTSLFVNADVAQAQTDQINDSLYLCVEDSMAECYQTVIDAYIEKYPEVNLQIETYPMQEYENARKRMNTELLAGEGPDLLLLGTYDNEDIYKLMKAGVFAPLDSFMEQDETYDESDYVGGIMNAGIMDGYQYIVPLSYSAQFALSSQECLEEIGFDLSLCDTFEGFFDQLSELYNRENKDRVLASSGGLDCFPELMGISLLDYENQAVLVDTSEMKWAMEKYKQMYDEDHTLGYDTVGFVEVGTAILERNAYFYILGNPGVAMQAASGIAVKETPVIIPIYTMDGKITGVINHSAAIRANSSNQENAWNFIRLLLEAQEEGTVLGGTYGYLPVNKKGLEVMIWNAAENISNSLAFYFDSGIAEELSENVINEFIELLAQPEHAYFFRKITLDDFVNGKMLPYFNGTETYEKCMEQYVSYAMIYISE